MSASVRLGSSASRLVGRIGVIAATATALQLYSASQAAASDFHSTVAEISDRFETMSELKAALNRGATYGQRLGDGVYKTLSERGPISAKGTSQFASVAATGGGSNFYIYVAGSDVAGDWGNEQFAQSAMLKVIDDFNTRPGAPRSQLLITYTLFNLGQTDFAAFYAPLQNDIKGIGYKHTMGPAETRSIPGYSLYGFVMMNRARRYLQNSFFQGQDSRHYMTALQEIGHRWGAKTYVNITGKEKIMLGRDDAHWSFFLNSGGSPMEGNGWVEQMPGVFASTTAAAYASGNYPTFSDLDLYLMGILPKEMVQPWFVIEGGDQQYKDCGLVFNCANGDVTIAGTKLPLTIENVIGAEGARVPASSSGDLHASVLILARPSDLPLTADLKSQLEAMVGKLVTFYSHATRGRGQLILDSTATLPALKGLGESCASSGECDPASSDQCSRSDAGDPQTCVKSCTATCGVGYCCAGALGTSMACFPGGSKACPNIPPPPPPDQRAVGERCDGPEQCAGGLCIEQPGFAGYKFCAAECTAASCPSAAFECAAASENRSVCVYKTSPPRQTGTACNQAAECDSGLCLPITGGQSCTQLCSDQLACPNGFQCVETTGTEKVCDRIVVTQPDPIVPGNEGGGGCDTTSGTQRNVGAATFALLAICMLLGRALLRK